MFKLTGGYTTHEDGIRRFHNKDDKKGFEVGRDLESMYGDMGKWMGAVSDIDNAEKQAKNPPLFGKLFKAGSIEEAALAAYAAKKKLEEQKLK